MFKKVASKWRSKQNNQLKQWVAKRVMSAGSLYFAVCKRKFKTGSKRGWVQEETFRWWRRRQWRSNKSMCRTLGGGDYETHFDRRYSTKQQVELTYFLAKQIEYLSNSNLLWWEFWTQVNTLCVALFYHLVLHVGMSHQLCVLCIRDPEPIKYRVYRTWDYMVVIYWLCVQSKYTISEINNL